MAEKNVSVKHETSNCVEVSWEQKIPRKIRDKNLGQQNVPDIFQEIFILFLEKQFGIDLIGNVKCGLSCLIAKKCSILENREEKFPTNNEKKLKSLC